MAQTPVRVLYVEDNPEFRDLTAAFLERVDDRFAVETAGGAADALDIIRRRPPDCIVSDYDMPGQNGIELLRSVRDEFPELPFILFTGKGSEAVAGEAISAGVTDYFLRGSGAEQYDLLANRIENAVEARRSADQLDRQTDLMRLTELLGDTGGCELCPETNEVLLTTGAQEILTVDGEDRITLDRWVDLFHPSDRETVREAVDTVAQTTEQVSHTLRLDPGTGERHVAVTLSFAGQTDGGAPVIRGALDDISEHRRRQRQLEQTRERMTCALDATDSKLFEIDHSTSQETRHGRFERLSGVDSESVPTTDAFLEKAVHHEDQEQFAEAIDEAVERAPATVEAEYRTDPGNGDLRWLQGRFSSRVDDAGEVTRIVGLSTDITAQKRREHELRQYRSLLEHINDAVFVVDSDRQLVYANQQSLANVNLEATDVTGEPILSLVEQYVENDAEIEAFEQALEAALNTDGARPDSVECTLSVDGTRLVLEYGFTRLPTGEAVAGATADETAVAVVARDITERKRRERQLERQNERLEEFTRIVSHDLRNPLNVAQGRLALAQEGSDSENLESVATALGRMEVLIDDLLMLARSGETAMSPERVLLSEVLTSCWETVPTAEATLEVRTEQVIRADRGRLKQLLENLFGNAVTYGGTGVTVTVGPMDDGFYVADDGPGIDTDGSTDIFEAGYSTADGGTGFGLRIVKEIVTAHGWEITVTESDAGGARFEITGVDTTD